MRVLLALMVFLATSSECHGELTEAQQNMAINMLTRQLQTLQVHLEEKIRTDGVSGIKQIRSFREGTRPYFSPHHIGGNIAAIHEHANNIRTVGLGEMAFVSNGVEFRTRHNDYRLYIPKKSDKYDDTEGIPFSEVPPSVKELPPAEQAKEMQEYFRAFKTQNVTHRDYRPYFKICLCYMETAWTQKTDAIVESFESDRHNLDASTWFEMQEKIRFTSYAGRKDQKENFAYLPTTIVDVDGLNSEYAQWNYRILCHKIQRDFPLKNLRLLNDFASRMPHERTMEQQLESRAAHFQVHPYDHKEEKAEEFNLLDELMAEIPGKSAYGAYMEDDMYGKTVKNYNDSQPLNAAYYHRIFKIGNQPYLRGFSDRNLYVALTDRPEVVAFTYKEEGKEPKKMRMSYAVPMEIVIMSPISSWNPWNITYNGEHYGNKGQAKKIALADGRNGGFEPDTAYNGTTSKLYYITPSEFYTSGEPKDGDAADTAKGAVGVLDPDGEVRHVSPAGTRIITPSIGGGVGSIRQRYPIMPSHSEGGAAWKEMEALRDAVLSIRTHKDMYREKPPLGPDVGYTRPGPKEVELYTGFSTTDVVAVHTHTIQLTGEDEANLKKGKTLSDVYTSTNNGHSHKLDIVYDATLQEYEYTKCDDGDACWDGHPVFLSVKI